MNALMASKGGDFERVPVDLEGKLLWTARFGKSRVGQYSTNGTWHAHVDMHVAAVGACFEIKSDFGMASPTAAVDQLIERIQSTLAKLTKA